MRREDFMQGSLPARRCLAVALCAALAAPAAGQIYRWVDEQGNVHFGDRPQEPAAAAAAVPVEIREAYRPPERSEQEQAAYEASLRDARELSTRRREREERLEQERSEAGREQKEEWCAARREALHRLTGYHPNESGRPTRYYIVEDGKSVSAARQQEFLEELRAEMEAAGC